MTPLADRRDIPDSVEKRRYLPKNCVSYSDHIQQVVVFSSFFPVFLGFSTESFLSRRFPDENFMLCSFFLTLT